MPGVGTTNVKFYALKLDSVAYAIIPMRLPRPLPASQTDQFLNGVQLGFTRSASAKLLSFRPIALNGVSGREFLVNAGNNRMRARVYARGNRAYQIIVVSPKSGAGGQSAQATKVLDSFRILK